MGSTHNLEMFGCGTPEHLIPFQLEFSEEFITEPQEVSFGMGRAPMCDRWRPMNCSVFKNEINWNSQYTDANIFTYYTNPEDYWSNEIIISRTNCCQIQFQYDDNSKSDIFDLGKYDEPNGNVRIPLFEHKKIIKVIVHKAKGKQLENLLYGRDSNVATETLIIGKEYALVKQWDKLWNKFERSDYSWKELEKKLNNAVLEKYPNFLKDTNKKDHNFSTDGKICSIEKVKILDVKPHTKITTNIENVEFKNYHIGCGYDVTYQKENGDVEMLDMGHDFTYIGEHSTIERKLAWFSDAYKSGKNSKEYLKILNEQISKLVDLEVERVNNEFLKLIDSLKGTSKTKLETVLIGNLYWTTKPLTKNNESILTMSKRFADIIPNGYRIPTKEDWNDLNKYFEKYDNKSKSVIYSDNKNKLTLKLGGYKSGNGSHWNDGVEAHFWMNMDNVKAESKYTKVVSLYKGTMNFEQQGIEPSYGAYLMLVKE